MSRCECRQPPTRPDSRSMTSTLCPAWAARKAKERPLTPAPRTTTSPVGWASPRTSSSSLGITATDAPLGEAPGGGDRRLRAAPFDDDRHHGELVERDHLRRLLRRTEVPPRVPEPLRLRQERRHGLDETLPGRGRHDEEVRVAQAVRPEPPRRA